MWQKKRIWAARRSRFELRLAADTIVFTLEFLSGDRVGSVRGLSV